MLKSRKFLRYTKFFLYHLFNEKEAESGLVGGPSAVATFAYSFVIFLCIFSVARFDPKIVILYTFFLQFCDFFYIDVSVQFYIIMNPSVILVCVCDANCRVA